jgi:hypothetical protein
MTRDPFEDRVPGSPLPPELSASAYFPIRSGDRQATVAAVPLRSPGMASAIVAALDRLEDVIDQEDRALAGRERPDFSDLNRRKSQCLLELTRLGRTLPPGAQPALRDRAARLRGKLLDNHRTLGLHIAAVKDIADLMVRALNEAESDGTYGKVRAPRDAKP